MISVSYLLKKQLKLFNNMKKTLIFLFFLPFSFIYGQGNDKILKVTYVYRVFFKEGDFDTVLYADNNHSQFVLDQKIRSLTTEEGFNLNISPQYYVSNYDFQKDKVQANRVIDKIVLSSQWKNDLVWEITDEEKEIAGYRVRKAITDSYGDKSGDDIYLGKAIAWFTTDIPIPAGPAYYQGLPGLIVSISFDKTRIGYTLKKVEYISKEDYTFVPLTDENAISKEDMIYNYAHSKEVKDVIKAAKKKKK